MSSTIRFNKRAQLVEALEARREWAEEHDRRMAAKHRAEEDEALKAFREKVKRLGRMNLRDLKAEIESERYYELRPRLPDCPASAVALLDAALERLAITRQETFVLTGSGDPVYRAYWLLTHDDDPKPQTVCAGEER